MKNLTALRTTIRDLTIVSDKEVLDQLRADTPLTDALRAAAHTRASNLVTAIRADDAPGLMELVLAEYGLSTKEGIALMCLAEAMLRVPDHDTMDALIEDKIAPSAWGTHLGKSSSSLVNASTWALMLTGKVLKDAEGTGAVLKGAIRRLGEPVIRTAVARAMKEMGQQFVLGETIADALKRGRAQESRGYTYSYDMLGEAAMTAADARDFEAAYADAIAKLAKHCKGTDPRENPGISVKLSALHPRYETGQKARVLAELAPRLLQLAQAARAAGMGLNIDAEEADRLDLSMDVIEAVLSDPSLAGWVGFGVVVQAYGKRAAAVIDWLYALAEAHDRKIMVRLVKGAYWDTEIKRAQVEGLPGFPVFATKPATDVSYLLCAKRLLERSDRIYPQFATHNAHSVATILEMATDPKAYEFQRLHGMGAQLHDLVLSREGTRCRIYAPVGAHEDLLAYLVRRLLENGANSSFVNQIVDETVPPAVVAADPFTALDTAAPSDVVIAPAALFGSERPNSKGWDLRDPVDRAAIEAARAPFATTEWSAAPLLAGDAGTMAPAHAVHNPARPDDLVGQVHFATPAQVETAFTAATPWSARSKQRAVVLNRAADLYEDNFGAFFALLTREAGKTTMDAISELREAVDFLRYYAARGQELSQPARGIITCVSPWNFPLAIFTGQIAAALAAGNGVLAKPAEDTSLTAFFAVQLLHQAGVPVAALQLVPGTGPEVGPTLTADPRVSGVCFTGSTATAQAINRGMAKTAAPSAPLIAETGGLNAMIIDSTALPEQAIRDVVASAFQSAGQRCSALRMLYLQKDIAKPFLKMLYGAMDEQTLGNPWDLATDIGPVINTIAQSGIFSYIAQARSEGRVLKEMAVPSTGLFIPGVVLSVPGIGALEREVFGPVLHVATFESHELPQIIADINATGYGLTFGLHSRIDGRVEEITTQIEAGNIYINRNQIGAVVGVQPFGGEGLSGTGPKAGGPDYVARFAAPGQIEPQDVVPGRTVTLLDAQEALTKATAGHRQTALSVTDMPGPTGESNRLTRFGRGTVLCLGPTTALARTQAEAARRAGCAAVIIAPDAKGPDTLNGVLDRTLLGGLTGFAAVALWSDEDDQRAARQALAGRSGALIPLLAEADIAARCVSERHVCIDTTAAGGNTALLAQAS